MQVPTFKIRTKKLFTFICGYCFLFTITTYAQELPEGFPDTDRTKTIINQGWKFHLGDPDAAYHTKDFDDTNWETVHVPHTLELTSLTLDGLKDDKTQLVFHRKVGWYRRNINIPNHQKNVFLEFEGVHQVTDLWINGKHVGNHSVGGYTPFHFDISDFVERGKTNQITVKADNRRSEVVPPDPGPFDYVKFSGLYRDVYLVETNPVYVTFNWEGLHSGVNITTPTIDVINKNATIHVKTGVRNTSDSDQNVALMTRILDSSGLVVRKLMENTILAAGAEHQFDQIGSLEDDVRFWGIDDPYLYRVNSVVLVNGKAVDFVENKIGLRKFEQDPIRGFILNNEPIELIGFNRHQQYPYVGDAVPNRLHYKDMLQFKEFGFNVMRTAHYPQDGTILEACDELGILVYEEAPTWIGVPQNDQWWQNLEKAARTMVRNHRNHPSVVMWGAGVNHRGYVPRIHNAVKQEDPTRLTASQGSRWTGWQASGLTDINANMLYGPVLWDRSEPLFAMEGKYGPEVVAVYKRDPLMTGIISWTAHAYYTFHPTHAKHDDPVDRTRSGAMTIFRYPRPQLHWYKSEHLQEPMVYIKEEWKQGTDSLTVFSNAHEVQLLLNDKLIARSGPSTDTIYDGLDHPPFEFKNIDYQTGKLVAKAYFKDGTTLEAVKHSPQKPYAIELEIDDSGHKWAADGSDIILAYATVVDRNGTTLHDFKGKVDFSLKGDAHIIGDEVSINANPMFTEYGVAPVLIRAGTKAGSITVSAKSKGLRSAKVTVNTIESSDDYIAKNASPIYDLKSERVDIGGADQLTQFGWNAWNGKDDQENSYAFQGFEGVTATLETGTSDGVVRWLGEINVIGKYGYAYGEGVIAIDDEGVNLVFNNLPKGAYRLTSWHHAPRSNSDSMDPNREKLKKMTIHKLPFESSIIVSSNALVGDKKIEAQVTSGKEMQWRAPGQSIVTFVSDGVTPVTINFNGKGDKGVWLNAFELSEWR